jgi:hypothetical protein
VIHGLEGKALAESNVLLPSLRLPVTQAIFYLLNEYNPMNPMSSINTANKMTVCPLRPSDPRTLESWNPGVNYDKPIHTHENLEPAP